jgi:tRNA(His) guanylyltransferase
MTATSAAVSAPAALPAIRKKRLPKSRFDSLGDRMKAYERRETERTLMPALPVIVRLDGRAFHTFTKGMTRPFYEPMSRAMIETARYMVKESHANFAYTQSDEITLGFWNDDPTAEQAHAGRVQKLVSLLAAMASVKFLEEVILRMPERAKKLPIFDARVFNLPNLAEAANCVLWRTWDCEKNSITMAASAYYPHKELQGKNGPAKHEMLFAKGVNWADYHAFFKNGTFLRRENVERAMTPAELARIPAKHRESRGGLVTRSSIVEVDMPKFGSLANPVGFLFHKEAPQLRTAPEALPDEAATAEALA